MCTLVVKIALQGELIDVMEMPTSEEEARAMFAAALSDDRLLPGHQQTFGEARPAPTLEQALSQSMEDGEIWIDLLDDDGVVMSDAPARFHQSDAAEVLQLHLGAPSRTVARCLSKASCMIRTASFALNASL